MKPEKKAKNVKVSKKKGNSTLIIGLIAIILLAGIAYAVLSKDSTNPADSSKKSMTLTEARAKIDAEYGKKGGGTNTPLVVDGYIPKLSPRAADQLPSYAYTNPTVLQAYKYATEHPEILEQIPCYCGCGGHSGHRFLRDCYIHDDGTYDDHASFCDVCIGEAIKVQNYLAAGTSTAKSTPSSTVKTSSPDLSSLSLADGFKSLADGLKLTPAGVDRAYFINVKMLTGTELETQYVTTMVQPDSLYGKKIIGMYSADFSPTSWIEMQDLGYDNTKDAALKARNEQGMTNIVYTRPLILGHSQNVDNVLKLMKEPNSMNTSYSAYKPLIEAVDYQNTGVSLIMTEPNRFSDMNYWSVTPANGKAELVKAYNITDNKSIPSAFNTYNPQIIGNILIIKVTGDPKTIQADADNIDTIART